MIASGDVSASLGEVPILPMSRKWGNSKGMYTVIHPSGNLCRRFLFLLEWEDEMETWSGHTAGPEAALLQAKADSWHWCGVVSRCINISWGSVQHNNQCHQSLLSTTLHFLVGFPIACFQVSNLNFLSCLFLSTAIKATFILTQPVYTPPDTNYRLCV